MREAPDPLLEIKRLLLEDEQRRIDELEKRKLDQAQLGSQSVELLPETLDRSHRRQPQALAAALRDPLLGALEALVRKRPVELTRTLFPLFLPAIRHIIADNVRAMAERINLMLDQALSWRSVILRWRAWRSGQRYADLLLRELLDFRVEHAMLINSHAGRLRSAVHHPQAKAQDPDAVAAMLTAIQDFVGDAFATAGEGRLARAQVGEVELLVAENHDQMLALAVRGTPNAELRTRLADTLDALIARYRERLDDDELQPEVQGEINDALLTLMVDQPRRRGGAPSWVGQAAVASIALGLALALGLWLQQRWARQAWVEFLDQEPGIVVVEHYGDTVAALIDRDAGMAQSAAGEAARHGLKLKATPYLSLDPPLVVARARRLLGLPTHVGVDYRAGVLHLTGTVDALPTSWPVIAGVERIDGSKLTLADQAWLRAARAALRLGPEVELRHDPDSVSVMGPLDLRAWAALPATAVVLGRELAVVKAQGPLSAALAEAPPLVMAFERDALPAEAGALQQLELELELGLWADLLHAAPGCALQLSAAHDASGGTAVNQRMVEARLAYASGLWRRLSDEHPLTVSIDPHPSIAGQRAAAFAIQCRSHRQ